MFPEQHQDRNLDVGQVVDDVGIGVHRELIGSGREIQLLHGGPNRGVPLLSGLRLPKPRSGGHQHQASHFVGVVHSVG